VHELLTLAAPNIAPNRAAATAAYCLGLVRMIEEPLRGVRDSRRVEGIDQESYNLRQLREAYPGAQEPKTADVRP
jgi:hypothetical protein